MYLIKKHNLVVSELQAKLSNSLAMNKAHLENSLNHKNKLEEKTKKLKETKEKLYVSEETLRRNRDFISNMYVTMDNISLDFQSEMSNLHAKNVKLEKKIESIGLKVGELTEIIIYDK